MSTCSTISGANQVVRVAKEVEYGKSLDTGFKKIAFSNNAINYTQNLIPTALRTGGRSPNKSGRGNIEVGGSLEIAIDDIQTGLWLDVLAGKTVTTLDFEPGKNLHSFKITDSCLDSFQIEDSILGTDVNYKATGLKVNSFSVAIGGEGEVLGTLDVIGQDKFKTTIQDDDITGTLSADININTKTFDLVDATGFEVGDAVILQKLITDTDGAVAANVKSIQVTDGSALVEGNYLLIDGKSYGIASINGNIIVLTRKTEDAIIDATSVYSVDEANIIEAITGNTITLKIGIKQDLIAATDTIQSQAKVDTLNGETFNHFEADFSSVNGTSISAFVETATFNFSNNIEAIRLIKNAGKIGSLIEGRVEITCDLEVLFGAENARFLEEAKNGKEFDLTITCFSSTGNYFKIIMPTGIITPATPEIGPDAIKVSMQYMPHKTDSTEAVEFQLLNEHPSY